MRVEIYLKEGVTEVKYKAEHKSQVRKKLLTSASQLIRNKGLSQVSVNDVMQSQGMTVGGFYAHFSSKEDVLLEAVRKAFEDSWTSFYDPLDNCENTQWFRHITHTYLSEKHVQDKDSMCPIAGLMSEVAKGSDALKVCFQENFKVTLNKIEERTGSIKASGIIALFAGTLQIAAACESTEFRRELFDNTVKCAVALMEAELD